MTIDISVVHGKMEFQVYVFHEGAHYRVDFNSCYCQDFHYMFIV